jgi:predicted transcriptional regulator
MPDARALLVSVKPVYADLLLAGRKTVELRRIRPHVDPGCEVLLYASSPTMEMVGTARVKAIEVATPDEIWQRHGPATGVDRTTFDAYFDGTDSAVAITLTEVRRLRSAVPLAELRRRIAGFRPPQSFRYLEGSDAAVVV